MASELFGGVFGFDTPGNAAAIEGEFSRMHRSPVLTANELFSKAITREYILLGYATQKATVAIDRVLSAFSERGSAAWHRFLNNDDNDIVSRTYREGFELAHLFLVTPQISFNPTLQELYEGHRREVVGSLVRFFSDFGIGQMREVYDHLHLHPRRDGNFQETVMLRRVAGTAH